MKKQIHLLRGNKSLDWLVTNLTDQRACLTVMAQFQGEKRPRPHPSARWKGIGEDGAHWWSWTGRPFKQSGGVGANVGSIRPKSDAGSTRGNQALTVTGPLTPLVTLGTISVSGNSLSLVNFFLHSQWFLPRPGSNSETTLYPECHKRDVLNITIFWKRGEIQNLRVPKPHAKPFLQLWNIYWKEMRATKEHIKAIIFENMTRIITESAFVFKESLPLNL